MRPDHIALTFGYWSLTFLVFTLKIKVEDVLISPKMNSQSWQSSKKEEISSVTLS